MHIVVPDLCPLKRRWIVKVWIKLVFNINYGLHGDLLLTSLWLLLSRLLHSILVYFVVKGCMALVILSLITVYQQTQTAKCICDNKCMSAYPRSTLEILAWTFEGIALARHITTVTKLGHTEFVIAKWDHCML